MSYPKQQILYDVINVILGLMVGACVLMALYASVETYRYVNPAPLTCEAHGPKNEWTLCLYPNPSDPACLQHHTCIESVIIPMNKQGDYDEG